MSKQIALKGVVQKLEHFFYVWNVQMAQGEEAR